MAEERFVSPKLYKNDNVWWVERRGSAYREHFHRKGETGRLANWKFNSTPLRNRTVTNKMIEQRIKDGWSTDAELQSKV